MTTQTRPLSTTFWGESKQKNYTKSSVLFFSKSHKRLRREQHERNTQQLSSSVNDDPLSQKDFAEVLLFQVYCRIENNKKQDWLELPFFRFHSEQNAFSFIALFFFSRVFRSFAFMTHVIQDIQRHAVTIKINCIPSNLLSHKHRQLSQEVVCFSILLSLCWSEANLLVYPLLIWISFCSACRLLDLVSSNTTQGRDSIKKFCEKPDLPRRHQEFCENGTNILQVIGKGVEMAIEECQYQFRMSRWSCSPSTGNTTNTIFGGALATRKSFLFQRRQNDSEGILCLHRE
jgi:hypothetical protein